MAAKVGCCNISSIFRSCSFINIFLSSCFLLYETKYITMVKSEEMVNQLPPNKIAYMNIN